MLLALPAAVASGGGEDSVVIQVGVQVDKIAEVNIGSSQLNLTVTLSDKGRRFEPINPVEITANHAYAVQVQSSNRTEAAPGEEAENLPFVVNQAGDKVFYDARVNIVPGPGGPPKSFSGTTGGEPLEVIGPRPGQMGRLTIQLIPQLPGGAQSPKSSPLNGGYTDTLIVTLLER